MRIHKNQIVVGIVLVFIFIFTSCEKYLDAKSDRSQIVPTTLNDLQALLDHVTTMNNVTSAFLEVSADDYFVRDEVLNTFPNEYDAYLWKEHVYTFASDWAKPYLAIYNANLCIERVAKVDKNAQNTDQWNNVYGSGLFFRSYYNLSLLWTYSKAFAENTADSDLGIVLRLGSDFNVASVRSTVRQCYQRVIEDLKEANQYLPDNPLQPLRPSKAASYGLLARTYLSMGIYDSAYKYSNLTLEIKRDLLDFNSTTEIKTGDVPFQAYPYNKEVIFYSIMGNGFALKLPSYALIDSSLYASYVMDDKRKTIFFKANANFQQFKGSYASNVNNLFTGLAVDEIYLMRAECHARLGRYMEGMADLNTLLQKRWATGKFVLFTASNSAEALAIILRERRKELLMRGLRWMDIKRINKGEGNIELKRVVAGQAYTLPPNDNRFALPLPDDIIKLTGIPQNPR